MRIEDKYKKNSNKFTTAGGGGRGGGGGNGTITIHTCAETGDLMSLMTLLRNNPSLLNERCLITVQTPLHIAAAHNRVEIVKYLLDWRGSGKVELEAKNVYGETPLHVAAKNGCTESVKMLLDYGANIEARTNNGLTPLHLAVGYALRSGDNLTVKTLLQYNANCSSVDNEGMTAFQYVPSCVENTELICLLMNQRPVNQFDNYFTSFSSILAQNNIGLSSGLDYSSILSQNNIGLSSGLDYSSILSQNNIGLSSGLDYSSILSQNNIGPSSGLDYSSILSQYNIGLSSGLDYSSILSQNDVGPSSGIDDGGMKGKLDEFENELSKIVGLHELKLQLRKWAKGMLMDVKRREMGVDLGSRKQPHMAFLGNPGTGKTTVARILGKLLVDVGALSSDTVTEVQRSDLVAEYLGQTGPKTKQKIDEAMGGVLFVDEAYRLAPEQSAGTHQDFGVEALEEIMSVLEDGEIVVIFAGYTEPMKRVFSSNEGFCRRVTHFFQFDDFTSKDLAEMVLLKMTKMNEKSRLYGFKLHPSCTYEAVLGIIEKNSTEKLRNKMNGGLVDHMLNGARENLDSRLNFDSKGDELLTITLSDLEAGLQSVSKRVNTE